MAEAELTDAELAAELREYGENVQLPFKNNKRQILIKKLNHLRSRSDAQNSKKSSPVNSRNRSPFRRSNEFTPTNSKTSPAPPYKLDDSRTRQFPVTPDSRIRQSSFGEHGSDDEHVDSTSNIYPTRSGSKLVQGQVANHLNAKDIREKKRTSQLSDSVLRTLRRRTVEPPQGRTHKSGVQELSTERIRPSYSNNSFNDGSDDEIPVPSPARSRLYPDLSKITSFLSNSHGHNYESSDSDVDENTSTSVNNKSNQFLNTSFSSAHSGVQDTNQVGYRTSYLNSSNNQARVYPSRRSYLNGHHRVQQYRSRYLEVLPQILVGVAVLFFIALFVTYVVIHKDFFFSWFSSPSSMGSDNNLLVCTDGNPSPNCYTTEEVDMSLKIIEQLFTKLSSLKAKALCDTSSESDDAMRVQVFRNQIAQEPQAAKQVERLYNCCIEHIMANPHWNIRALTDDDSTAKTVNDVTKLQSKVAAMGVMCRFWRSFSTVMYGIFMMALVIGCILLLSIYIKYRLKQKEAEQKDVYAMVEKIIDILQNHYEQTKDERPSEPQYLAVQHVRDQLLPPPLRRKLQPIWDKAVAFIAANESRIRLETRTIQGDEFEVWHWLQPALHNGKIWQGQAFGENSENRGNNQTIYSPTPCLKIRNMFDSNVENEDNWEDSVTDAILEKCRNIDSIVHIFVDVDSREGCVYLKCSSLEAAGKARLALHGWWFDGRLVTVKHLKTEHYHKRWPEAQNATKPLKPSTDQMRSLSQPYYRSSLEMT